MEGDGMGEDKKAKRKCLYEWKDCVWRRKKNLGQLSVDRAPIKPCILLIADAILSHFHCFFSFSFSLSLQSVRVSFKDSENLKRASSL